MTKEVNVRATWYSYHTIEVPDDWRVPSNLDGFPEEALEEITSDVAELVDWEEW